MSLYDTTPLKDTLERLVDFDLLNNGTMRLSVGAVNVRTGNFSYFDTSRQRLDARHIMASAALPPGFPPVEIDGEWYWDGGLLSNTPLDYVLEQHGSPQPPDLPDRPVRGHRPAPGGPGAGHRAREGHPVFQQDAPQYQQGAAAAGAGQAARRLFARLPKTFADDPDLITLKEATCERTVTVVHLIYRRVSHETHSKDYEFSRLSMLDHWRSGRRRQGDAGEPALENASDRRGRGPRIRPDAPAPLRP